MAISLSYQSQTPQHVTVGYVDLPFPTDLWIIQGPSGNQVLSAGARSGSGSAALAIGALPAGDYYVLARNGGKSLAQTVAFHVA